MTPDIITHACTDSRVATICFNTSHAFAEPLTTCSCSRPPLPRSAESGHLRPDSAECCMSTCCTVLAYICLCCLLNRPLACKRHLSCQDASLQGVTQGLTCFTLSSESDSSGNSSAVCGLSQRPSVAATITSPEVSWFRNIDSSQSNRLQPQQEQPQQEHYCELLL